MNFKVAAKSNSAQKAPAKYAKTVTIPLQRIFTLLRFEVKIMFFRSDAGGSAFLRNAGTYLQNYTASHPRRQQFSFVFSLSHLLPPNYAGLYVRVFSLCFNVLCRCLATGRSPSKGVLPAVCKIHSFKLILKRGVGQRALSIKGRGGRGRKDYANKS
jgi:hypothetical protein